MEKTIIILNIILLTTSSCGQISNKQTNTTDNSVVCEQSKIEKNHFDLFFPLKKEFEWANIEKQNHILKAEFIKNHPNEFEYYRYETEYMPTLSNLEEHLHIIDFNDDGLDDIIFDGYSGGEPMEISIFINTGNSFVKIFTEYQKIHKIIFENGKIQRLYIQDDGCCAESVGINKFFHVDYSSKLPKVNKINEVQYILDRTEYPNKYFEKPIKFEILNNNYNIRFSPVIDDTTEVYYRGESGTGNSLGKIKSGSIGYALAEKIDLTGRIWWFVVMNPKSEIYESLYYDEQYRPNTYKLGWISNRFVKEIKE